MCLKFGDRTIFPRLEIIYIADIDRIVARGQFRVYPRLDSLACHGFSFSRHRQYRKTSSKPLDSSLGLFIFPNPKPKLGLSFGVDKT